MKVAVASSDGIMVNQHFGRADSFYVYEIQSGVKFLEKRKGVPFCHGGTHDDGELLDAVTLLGDCQLVFVLDIGWGAEEALARQGIKAVVSRGFIEEALEEYDDLRLHPKEGIV